MSEAAFFAALPTLYGAAAMLFTDEDGQVLLVKPNYRDHWSLPGGILEHGERPQDGAAREVAEELSIEVTPGPLLAVAWTAPEDPRPRPIVHFIFDGGVLRADAPGIVLQHEELDDYRFVDPGSLAAYLPPLIAARVAAALRARTAAAPVAYVSGSSA